VARRPRLFVEGLAHHVVQRGNNRSVIFESPQDYRFFLRLLADASIHYQLQIHAYVLMTNHVHLLVTPLTAGSIAASMQAIGRCYVPYFNQRNERTGALFEGRYRSTIVGTESYFMTCMRYIELNPVRAGLTNALDSYRWSSYRAHGRRMPDPLVTNHHLYLRLGEHPHDRCIRWRAICESCVSADDLERMRRDLRAGGLSRDVPAPQP
jgi:putative transposase